MEVAGRRALIEKDWKAVSTPVPIGDGDWELYHLAEDPAERNNLAADRPERLLALVEAWANYADNNNVILPEGTPIIHSLGGGAPAE